MKDHARSFVAEAGTLDQTEAGQEQKVLEPTRS